MTSTLEVRGQSGSPFCLLEAGACQAGAHSSQPIHSDVFTAKFPFQPCPQTFVLLNNSRPINSSELVKEFRRLIEGSRCTLCGDIPSGVSGAGEGLPQEPRQARPQHLQHPVRPLHCARLRVRSWGWECGKEDTTEEGGLNHWVLSRCLGTST